MSVQSDIDVFLYRCQKRTATLGTELLEQEDQGNSIDDIIDTIIDLDNAIYLFQNRPATLSDDEAYEIISYLNKKAELTKLPLSLYSFTCGIDNVVLPGGYVSGPQGEDGPQGATGKSAYQIAVEDGFVGTEAEWLDSLVGDTGADGDDGNDGWSAIPSIVTDGARKVIKITGWTGGTGTAPAADLYIGVSGFVSDIADAVDIRGVQGIQGIQGIAGNTGSTGVSSYTYIAYADDASGTGFTVTFNESKDYIGIRTTTSPISPVTAIAFTGLWKNYKGEQGDSFEIDAQGPLVDRDLYDAEAKGFTFLDHDGGDVYIKKSSFSGDWSDPFPFIGYSGWNPIPAVIIDGDRRVLQIIGWAGGEGVEPDATGMYVGNTGIVATAAEAEDIRGPIGERFFPDAEGDLVDRDDYDDELADFIYHAVDLGLVYIKLSDTSADWSTGYTWRGAAGVAGPIGPAGTGFNDECLVATTADLAATYSGVGKTLTANANGVLTVDGVTPSLNARILVKNESTGADNGIYIATDLGSVGSQWVLTRADDFNTTLEAKKFFQVFIEQGTVNQGTRWGMTNTRPALALDTTALVFAQDKASLSNYLPLTGGTMSGDIDMDGNAIVGSDIYLLVDGGYTKAWQELTQTYTAIGFGGDQILIDSSGMAFDVAGSGHNMIFSSNNGDITLSAFDDITIGANDVISINSNSMLIGTTSASAIDIGYASSVIGLTGTTKFNSLTASTLAYLDASKNFISLANAAGVLTNNGSGGLSWGSASGTTFADNVFRVQDNGDATKQLAFEVSGVTTGTTRTLTVPNTSGTIALTSDISALSSVYQPLDSDLTTIAGLTATTDNFIVSVSSAWASRTPAQVKTTLSLNNVENTALSTWAGSSNITTVGALTSGSLSSGFTAVADAQISSASTWNAKFTLPSLTAGSVLYSNGTTIVQDNSNFYFASGLLNVGTAGDQTGTDVINIYKMIDSYTANASDNGMSISHSRGTGAVPTQSSADDYIGPTAWYAHNGTTFPEVASIRGYVEGATSTARGARLEFWTKINSGVLTKAGTIDSNQLWTIGSGTALGKFNTYSSYTTTPTSFTLTSGATTNIDTTITYSSNTTVKVGDFISGTGIQASTIITRIISATSAVISRTASATGSGLTFTIRPANFLGYLSGANTEVSNGHNQGLFLNIQNDETSSGLHNRGLVINYTGGVANAITRVPVEIISDGSTMLAFTNAGGGYTQNNWSLGVTASGFLLSPGGSNTGMYYSQTSTTTGSLTFNASSTVTMSSSTVTLQLRGVAGGAVNTNYTAVGVSHQGGSGGGVGATSGTVNILGIGPVNANTDFNPISGSAVFNHLFIGYTINQTGSSSGTVRGVYYSPTLTAVLGTHYCFEATSGLMKLADATDSTTITTGSFVTAGGMAVTKALSVGTTIGLADTTVKTVLDVSAANTLRLANGMTTPTITTPASTINFTGGSTSLTSTAGGVTIASTSGGNTVVLRVVGDANANSGVNLTMNGSATNGSTNRAIATINGTYAPTSGTTAIFRGVNLSPTINETSTAANEMNLLDVNPTLTSVKGTIYGIRSRLSASPTGGGVAWNIYSDGTASNVIVGSTMHGSTSTPTALLHLAAGTATASTSPLKFTSGTNLTTAEAGAMEYNGTNLFFTRAGTTRENILVAVDNASAPSTSVGVGIVNYYGSAATNFLGDPNRWLSVNVLGSVYKIPLYT